MKDRTEGAPARPGRSRPWVLLACALLLAWPARDAAAGEKLERRARLPKGFVEVDGVAAVVGRQVITISALVRSQGRQSASQSMVPTDAERPRSDMAMLRQTLDSMIENELVATAARDMGLTVSDEEVDAHLKEMQEKNVWDMEELRSAVKRLGFMNLSDYRDHVRTEKLRVNMLRAKLGSRLRITEQEVQRIVDAEFQGGTVEDEIRSRHILIKVPANASPPEVNALRSKAWKIYDLVIAGEKTFAQLAEEHSDDMGTEEGGDLGYMRRWMLDPSFGTRLWSLKKGEVSKVIQTPFGFHIIQMIDRRRVPVKDKRILEQMVRASLTEQQFVRLYNAWMAELKATTHIEVRL